MTAHSTDFLLLINTKKRYRWQELPKKWESNITHHIIKIKIGCKVSLLSNHFVNITIQNLVYFAIKMLKMFNNPPFVYITLSNSSLQYFLNFANVDTGQHFMK